VLEIGWFFACNTSFFLKKPPNPKTLSAKLGGIFLEPYKKNLLKLTFFFGSLLFFGFITVGK